MTYTRSLTAASSRTVKNGWSISSPSSASSAVPTGAHPPAAFRNDRYAPGSRYPRSSSTPSTCCSDTATPDFGSRKCAGRVSRNGRVPRLPWSTRAVAIPPWCRSSAFTSTGTSSSRRVPATWCHVQLCGVATAGTVSHSGCPAADSAAFADT
ncbi:hypothetical protein SFUMM280S_08039 [Streptomyces fumanus]